MMIIFAILSAFVPWWQKYKCHKDAKSQSDLSKKKNI
jgi:hypothetical protein